MKRYKTILSLFAFIVLCGTASAAEPWTLRGALEQALTNSPDARLARSRIAAAQAGLEQANASFWPRVQFQSSYTRTDNPMMVFGSILNQRTYPAQGIDFNDVPDIDNLTTRGVVTVPLYAGGRTKAARQAAKATTEAARQDDQAVRNALGFEVARAFHTVLKTREYISAAEATVNSFQTNLDTANVRFQAGAMLKTDVLDFKVRLAQAREDLVRARNANALAKRTLRNLLGIESGDIEVEDSVPEIAVPSSSDFSGRAELAAARLRERAAEERVRGEKSGYLPRVSAFGSLDYDHGWRYNHGGGSYSAGGLLQWDLWDGNLTRSKVREARANADSAREELRKLRLNLGFEVEQAQLEFQAATERLNVSEQTVLQATESAALTRSRFEQGSALSSQLIDAETALLGARVRRAEAEADRRIAAAAVRKALGLDQMDLNSNKTNTKQHQASL